MKKTNIIHIVLMNPGPVPAFIIHAGNIVAKIGADPVTFPKPSPALSLVTTHIGDLTAAETAAKSRTVGTVTVRDDKRMIVATDLRQLAAFVEGIANANPDTAAAIAEAAGMRLKNKGTLHKSDLAVGKHTATGSVHLVAKAVKGAHAYDWEFSSDGGKTWTPHPTSLQARTTVANLQVGVMVYFRHRSVTKLGPSDWGQPISTLVV